MNATDNKPHPASDMQVHASDAAGLMKALGNESRLMILCVLAEGERSVSDLNTIVPLSQSALSQQLARLRQQGVVKTRRESQTIFYSLADGPADRVINLLHDIYCGSVDCATKD
jgi:DNA-binding transcriptional ArsR family regulator